MTTDITTTAVVLNPLYPAMFKPLEEGGIEVIFRDLPEANIEATDFTDAVQRAEDSLIAVKKMFDEDDMVLPEPTRAHSGDVMIELKLTTDK